nr:MAG TPA: hypothetical protein [Caudoviricetes sp.]
MTRDAPLFGKNAPPLKTDGQGFIFPLFDA